MSNAKFTSMGSMAYSLILSVLVGMGSYIHAQPAAVINAWKNDARLASASYGLVLAEAQSGKEIYSFNKNLFLVPASTLKLFTTGAAAALLKPSFRFETSFSYTGGFVDGTIQGDLVVVGNGDVTLYSEHFDTTGLLLKWVQQLKKAGVKKISGNLIAADTKWHPNLPDHWIWSDISNYYGAAPLPFSYRDNKFKIWLRSYSEGSQVEIVGTEPPQLFQQMQLTCSIIAKGTSDQAYVYGDPFGYNRLIEGSIPANKSRYDIDGAMPNPGLWFATDLYKALKANGIEITGKPLCEKNVSPQIQGKLFSHYSPTLDKIIRVANSKSNNLFTEGLVYAIGNGNYKQGLKAIKDYWSKKGISQNELFMYDGCGLSRSNLVTPEAFKKLLSVVYNDSLLSKSIWPSLPICGKEGSMAHVGKGSLLENNMRAKTGHIEHVRAYAGYVKNRQGKELLFIILLNNYNCNPSEARLLIEKMMLSFIE